MKGFVRNTVAAGGAALAALVGVAVVLLFGMAVAAMAIFGVGLFQRKTAHFRGGTQATEIVQSGRHQIAEYDHFFDLCAGVQALEQKARLYADDPTARAGVLGARADLVAQYNADARKWTSGQFRDDDLPYQLDPESQETRCEA